MLKIVLCKPVAWYKFFDDLLMYFDGTDFSHVAIEFDGYIYESVYPRSRRIKKDEWLKHYMIVREYQHTIPIEYKSVYKSYLEMFLFRKYSQGQIMAIGLGFVNKVFEKLFNKELANKDKYLICTEYACYVLMKIYNVMIEDIDTISLKEIEQLEKTLRASYGDFRKY